MSDPERPTSGYASQMTAGGAWIDIPASDLADKVGWISGGSAWAEDAVRTANLNRRDLRDSYSGRITEPIHAAADRVVASQGDVADHAQQLLRWWTRVEDQIAGTKSMILRAVDLALEEIEAIEAATGVDADKKKQAIDQLVEMVHGENLAMVDGAAGMIGPAPQPHYTPPFVGQESPFHSAGMSNKPGASITGLKNERGIGKTNDGGEDGKSSERGGVGHGADSKDKNHDKAKDGSAEEKDERGTKAERGNAGHGSDKSDDVKLLERGNADQPASIQPIQGQQPTLPMSPASPMSGAGAGGGSPAAGMGSLGSGLGRGPSASGVGSGAGSGTPAATPMASQASLVRAFGGATGLDPAAAGPVARPAPLASASPVSGPPAVPITAAQGTPPPVPVQPAAVTQPPPAVPAQTAAPLPGGGLPLMGPSPATANSLASAPPAAPLAATAGPAVPLTGGGASSTATVVPMTPGERARQLVVRSTRQMLGDIAGEARRLAAALTASTKNLPTLQWVVGGCPDDGSGPLLVVASSVGLGFIPASTRLPRHTAVHVFGESPSVPWGIKRGWLGNPLNAVQGYGVSINRPVTVVAGRPEALVGAQVGIELVTPDNIPDSGVQGGRDRLEVVDPAQFDQISTLGTAALAALLPTAGGFEAEPNNDRAMALWTAVDMAATVGESHLIKAWQDFCTDQATASAYKVTRADSDLTARQYYSDYAYFVWNLAQLEKALEAAA